MISSAHPPEERGRVQGTNDAAVFGLVRLARLREADECTGGDPVEGWAAVNLAMAPFLAPGGLLWLVLSRGPARAAA